MVLQGFVGALVKAALYAGGYQGVNDVLAFLKIGQIHPILSDVSDQFSKMLKIIDTLLDKTLE